jgi:hypothetical protein
MGILDAFARRFREPPRPVPSDGNSSLQATICCTLPRPMCTRSREAANVTVRLPGLAGLVLDLLDLGVREAICATERRHGPTCLKVFHAGAGNRVQWRSRLRRSSFSTTRCLRNLRTQGTCW